MNYIKNMINNYESKPGRYFDGFIQFLILSSLFTFSISTIPNLNTKTIAILYKIEVFIISIFTIEYFLRLMFSNMKIKYIFSFFGIIDLLAIIPFYLSFGVDLRSLRVIRLIRLVKLFRFNNSLLLLKKAFLKVKSEMILFIFITGILLYISAVGIYFCENSAQPEKFKSVFHCLWWSITTLTTVGYGDMFPITLGGKIFTSLVSLTGIGIVAIPTGLLASSLSSITKDKKTK